MERIEAENYCRNVKHIEKELKDIASLGGILPEPWVESKPKAKSPDINITSENNNTSKEPAGQGWIVVTDKNGTITDSTSCGY